MRYPLSFASFIAVALILVGCGGEEGQAERHHTPPDEKTVRAAEAAAATDPLDFRTAETIEASSFGLLGDGITDNTALFKALLGNGNRTIRIEAGDYVTGSLEIPSNTILKLDPGVIIRDSA
jgi:polygalacturonase